MFIWFHHYITPNIAVYKIPYLRFLSFVVFCILYTECLRVYQNNICQLIELQSRDVLTKLTYYFQYLFREIRIRIQVLFRFLFNRADALRCRLKCMVMWAWYEYWYVYLISKNDIINTARAKYALQKCLRIEKASCDAKVFILSGTQRAVSQISHYALFKKRVDIYWNYEKISKKTSKHVFFTFLCSFVKKWASEPTFALTFM